MNNANLNKENLKYMSKNYMNYIYELGVIEYLLEQELIENDQANLLIKKLQKLYTEGT